MDRCPLVGHEYEKALGCRACRSEWLVDGVWPVGSQHVDAVWPVPVMDGPSRAAGEHLDRDVTSQEEGVGW